MSGALFENFLSTAERQTITQQYIHLLELIKPEELMLILVHNGHMSSFEKSDFQSKTDNEKGQYIIDNVFLKTTYQQLQQIRRCLFQSRSANFMAIARLLPSRGECLETETDSLTEVESSQPVVLKESGSRTDILRPSSKGTQPTDEESEVSFGIGDSAKNTVPPADLSISQVSGIQTSHFDSGAPDISSLSLNTEDTCPPMSVAKSPSNQQLVSKLRCYPVKEGNPKGTGEGLVIVLANFTDELLGYQKDTEDIKAFFKDQLKYKHVYAGKMNNTSLMNLCREEMLGVLKVVQDFLTNPMSGCTIDRFYLFLLSHGNEEGILTCEKGTSTKEEYDESGELVTISMQEIVDMFTHDKVPSLKGFPKVIFRQTCQGEETLKAATFPVQPSVALHPVKPSRPLAIGADVMICEATSLSYRSYVGDKTGSVFIQTAVKAMKQYYMTDHLLDILTEVNWLVAVTQNKSQDPESQKIYKAVQMPGIISRLTAKLYLKDPPVLS